MSNTTISTSSDTPKTPDFETTLTVDARFAGGTISIKPEPLDWLGETLVRVDMPGHSLSLRTFEARDFALQLLNSAAHIDEESPREIRRITEPGAPRHEELIGAGL